MTLARFEPGTQERIQRVFAIWSHRGEHLFPQGARLLERFGIGGLALDDDNLALFIGRGQFRIRLLHREERPVHHQTDVTEDKQSGEHQEHFFRRPAVWAHRIALLDHVIHYDLTAAPATETDIRAEVL